MAAVCKIPVAESVSSPLQGLKLCVLSTIPISTSRVVNRQCRAMAQAGAEVTLISPNPHEAVEGRFAMRSFPCAKGAIGKLLSSPAVLRPALAERADIYHVHTFQLVPIAVVLKLIFRKHVVYDMFEDFPSMVLTRGWRPEWLRGVVARAVYLSERMACAELDGVITADPAVLRQYLPSAKSRTRRKRVVFYNFPSLDVFFRRLPSATAPAKRYDVVYSGGMSDRTGVFVLLDAIAKLASSGLRPKVLMFGYSDTPTFKAEFLKVAKSKGIEDCFELLGRIPHEQVPQMLMQARVGVVPLQPIPKFLKNIPTKVFEYWACGLPIVASDLPPIRPFFREGRYGYLVDPGSSDAFAAAIRLLLESPAMAERMGEQARHAVLTRFNVLPEQRKLIRLYRQIAGVSA